MKQPLGLVAARQWLNERLMSDTATGASPAMAQWFAIKARHEDALLFFRMGDFYELFFADAQAAAAALDIALTARGEHQGQPIPMCGVPVSQAEMYLARLIRRGFRVAVVEQMEDPAAAKARGAKGPLRRDVVRLVTPGTLTEEALLEAGRANFLRRHRAAWGAARHRLGGHLHRPVRDRGDRRGRAAGPARPAGPGRDPRRAGIELGAVRDKAGGHAAPSHVRPRHAGGSRRELAQKFGAASLDAFGGFLRRRGARRRDWCWPTCAATQTGAMPRLAHPAAAGVRRAAGHGCRHPRQPGTARRPRRQ